MTPFDIFHLLLGAFSVSFILHLYVTKECETYRPVIHQTIIEYTTEPLILSRVARLTHNDLHSRGRLIEELKRALVLDLEEHVEVVELGEPWRPYRQFRATIRILK